MSYVEYNSNNSGGHWWLTDEDWYALVRAGWKVHWVKLGCLCDEKGNLLLEADGTPKLIPVEQLPPDSFERKFFKGERWLGALAQKAYRAGLSLRDAAEEWEKVTGESACDAGCPCCGRPHTFTEYDDNGYMVQSGPSVNYEASWD